MHPSSLHYESHLEPNRNESFSTSSISAFRFGLSLASCRCQVLFKESRMRWTPGGRSSNLEDRRGFGGGMGGYGFGGGGLRLGLGGVLVLLVLSVIFKRDF